MKEGGQNKQNQIKLTKVWEFNHEKDIWQRRMLNEKEVKVIDMYSKLTFNAFMTKPYMVAILNRNIASNTL